MPRFITRERAETLPSLDGLTDEQRAAVVELGERVYEYLRVNEFAPEAAIRTWAEAQGVLDPDVVTRALNFLRESGQIFPLADVAIVAAQAARGVLEELDKDELMRKARELDIPGRSGMSKPELVRAIEESAGRRAGAEA